jgi:hypothetical protein
MHHENNGCIGHPITNMLMRAACAADMSTADHADHGAVPDLGGTPAPAVVSEAPAEPVSDLARVESKVDMLLSHFGLLNTGS